MVFISAKDTCVINPPEFMQDIASCSSFSYLILYKVVRHCQLSPLSSQVKVRHQHLHKNGFQIRFNQALHQPRLPL